MEDLTSTPFTPAGVVADASARLGRTWTSCCGRPGPPRSWSGRSRSSRRCAAGWPRSRPRCWPRSTPARSPRPTSAGAPPPTGSPTWPAPTARPGTAPCARPASWSTELPATHAALRAGRVSPEQAAVIADAIDRLPHKPELRGRAEALLLDEATRLNATDLAKAAQAPARGGRSRAGRPRRREGPREGRPGRPPGPVPLDHRGRRRRGPGPRPGHRRGRRHPRTALLPLTAPAPALDPDTGEETSTPATTAPGSGTPWSPPPPTPWPPTWPPTPTAPGPGSPSPPTSTPSATGSASPPPHRNRRRGLRRGGADRLAHPGRGDPGHRRRPHPHPRRGPPAGLRRRPHPRRPRHPQRGPRRRPHPPPGHRTPVAGPGLPRPALRLPRLHPTTRDVPRPPHRHWLHGGKTKLANLVLLCGHHHRVIHHTPWEVRLNPDDGRPEFLPPPKLGQPQDWIRHRPRRE